MGWLAAAAGIASYSVLVLASGADRISREDVRAAALVPPSIAASSEQVLAERALARGDAETALLHSRLAVNASPMDARAIGLLGESNLRSGRTDAAFDAMSLGQSLGWRDAGVQAYLFEQAMGNADAPRAALHLDALLRTRPGDAAIRPAIDRVLALDTGAAALLERLAAQPRWRGAVLGELDRLDTAALQRRAGLVESATKTGALSCAEAAQFASAARASGIAMDDCPTG